jgi:hypothetical protein
LPVDDLTVEGLKAETETFREKRKRMTIFNMLLLIILGSIATIGLAAVVPSFLAVGDTAKRQQEEFEEENTKKGGFKPKFGKKPISGVKVGEKKKAANALQKGGKGKGSKDIEEPAKKKGLFGR